MDSAVNQRIDELLKLVFELKKQVAELKAAVN